MDYPIPFKATLSAILAVAAVFLYPMIFQGSRGIWEPDEGRYTSIACNMLRTGDYVVPSLNRQSNHFAKPPLAYWAIAAGIKLLGRNEWGARLFNALAFSCTIMILLAISRRLMPGQAWLPPLIYTSFAFPFAAANIVTTDTLLTLWEVLAVFGFVLHWSSRRERTASGGLLLMWSAFGLAFLTKGPPGLLALVPIACFVGALDGRKGVRRLLSLRGLLVFAIIGLFWYFTVMAREPSLLAYFLRDEVLGRVFSARLHRNPEWYGPFRIYGPVLIAGSLPWTFSLLSRTYRAKRALLSGTWWRTRFQHDPWLAFLLLWALVPLVILCASRSRLPLYALPVFAPLALLTARTREGRPLGHRIRLLLAVWFVLLPALKGIAAFDEAHRDDRQCARELVRSLETMPRILMFVDCRAHWGLSFYMDCEIREVEFMPPDNPRSGPKPPLIDELARRNSGVVLVVPPGKLDRLLNTTLIPAAAIRQMVRTELGVLIVLDG